MPMPSLGRNSLLRLRPIRCAAAAIATLLVSSLLGACATGPYTYNEGSTRVARYTTKAQGGVGLYLPTTDMDHAATIIKRGDAFSVRLLAAFVCDFRESSSVSDMLAHGNSGATPCAGGDGNQQPGTRGEIAIAASVGERGTGGGLSFDAASIKNGRVIYYNEDVRETGQLINAMNLPVYGPKTYDGRPFYMDWSVLELDNKENAAARNLLKQLADAGTLMAAPYTPVLKLLNTLGGALIGANNDDLEMHFQMETDSALDCARLGRNVGGCVSIAVDRMPLREGYYAFIRSENRSERINPENMGFVVCTTRGILCEPGEAEIPWGKRSWLLVRVAREDRDAALAQDSAQALAGLMESLSANATSTTVDEKTLKELSGEVKKVVDRIIDARQ